MKGKIIYILVIALFAACSSDNQKSKQEIIQLEKALEENPGLDNADALVEAYKQYITDHPTEAEMNSKFLYRAASVQYRMNRFSGAIDLLRQGLKDYPNTSNSVNNGLLLGAIYEQKLRNAESANTVYQALAIRYPDNEEVQKANAKLGAQLPPLDSRIEALGMRMFNDSTGRIEYRVANDYINSCELHGLLLPDDPKTPVFLHKAGETARSIRTFKKALELYEWVGTNYPDFEKAPQSLFLRAFTLDNDLKRFDEARVLYEEFLQKYPNDDFADDTEFLLKNLGKNDEEIINSFSSPQ